jgi:integrase
MFVRVHLTPYFRDRDVRDLKVADVQAFHDHCVDIGKPRSFRSIELALATLRLILSHARAQGLVEVNAVEAWKRGRGRRRSVASKQVDPQQVLSFDEVQELLRVAEREEPEFHPLILFLVDTGARFGEATALRWIDVDLDQGTARITRSFSSGEFLGPTKTGRERRVELSTRLSEVLRGRRPDLFPDDELVFSNEAGGFINPRNFRQRTWNRAVRKALGRGRTPTPHSLRHTFASLHMARGTNLKWLQAQGGWASAKMLLDVYGHYLPGESRGFADALSTAPNGTIRHQDLHGESTAPGKI